MGEEQKKWCPLSFNVRPDGVGFVECHDSCAWWNDYWKKCGFISELTGLALNVKELRYHFAGPNRQEKGAKNAT